MKVINDIKGILPDFILEKQKIQCSKDGGFGRSAYKTLRKAKSLTHACELTAKYMKSSSKTVAKWRDNFIESGTISGTKRGKYERTHQLFNDEGLKEKALSWIRANSCKKGQPNMAVSDFCHYINDMLLHPDGEENISPSFPREVSTETPQRWLHELGFSVKEKKKGMYVDGHDREDVVEYQNKFLEELKQMEDSHLPPPKPGDEIETEEEQLEREKLKTGWEKRSALDFP